MHRMVLLRHAKSAYPVGTADHDRPLSDRGIRNAKTVADHLSAYLPAGAHVTAAVSTALRTQQTWGYVSERIPVDSWNDRSLYLATADTLWRMHMAFDSDIGIIVGHNPGIEDLARRFPGAADVVDDSTGMRLVAKFPTSAFAVLDCPTGDWRPDMVTCAGFKVCR